MEISPLQSSLAANHALTVSGRCSVDLAQTAQHYQAMRATILAMARITCCAVPLQPAGAEYTGVALDAPQRLSCSMHEHFVQIRCGSDCWCPMMLQKRLTTSLRCKPRSGVVPSRRLKRT